MLLSRVGGLAARLPRPLTPTTTLRQPAKTSGTFAAHPELARPHCSMPPLQRHGRCRANNSALACCQHGRACICTCYCNVSVLRALLEKAQLGQMPHACIGASPHISLTSLCSAPTWALRAAVMGGMLSLAVHHGAASAVMLCRAVGHALALGGFCEGRMCGVSRPAPADSVRHLARADERKGQHQVFASSHRRGVVPWQVACLLLCLEVPPILDCNLAAKATIPWTDPVGGSRHPRVG
jgi:hypothetical protein